MRMLVLMRVRIRDADADVFLQLYIFLCCPGGGFGEDLEPEGGCVGPDVGQSVLQSLKSLRELEA